MKHKWSKASLFSIGTHENVKDILLIESAWNNGTNKLDTEYKPSPDFTLANYSPNYGSFITFTNSCRFHRKVQDRTELIAIIRAFF